MEHSVILDGLNARQSDAVTSNSPHVLVLAGAGSGKTKVLVHRVAWYLETGQALPSSVLAVTFTNKAATEMRHRIRNLTDSETDSMWVGTFHNIAHRILRHHWKEAGLKQRFQIIDSDDQLRLIKRLIKDSGFKDEEVAPKEAQWFINNRKDRGERPEQIDDYADQNFLNMVKVYKLYEQACQRAGLVDFAELLLSANDLWRKCPALLAQYRRRFRHILVDEFQDTNAIQYAWLRQLAGSDGHLFAVGDDDQSIYSWRGAQVENMQKFRDHFTQHHMVRLEQNYRSTSNILDCANSLISYNPSRIGKELWTDGAKGEPVSLYSGYNDLDESRFVADRVSQWFDSGYRLSECAILYRVSAQSRVLEDALRQTDIPYRVYGGFRFYERAEIKDALAYVRLVNSRADDAALERIVNLPSRGIGLRSLEQVRLIARERDCTLWSAIASIIEDKSISARAIGALKSFVQLIDQMTVLSRDESLAPLLENIISLSSLEDHYKKEKGERGFDRIENLNELIAAAEDFSGQSADEDMSLLDAFLAHAALESGEGQVDENEDGVQLMTLHSAKGLEFPLVFIVGVEEGLFPHQRSVDDPLQLEEERRLCYVGITRAMKKLIITNAESRRLHGSEYYPRPSRFLNELPEEALENIRVGGSFYSTHDRYSTDVEDTSESEYNLGCTVRHKTFGEGTVLQVEGRGDQARLQVNFVANGSKWLVAGYAGLEKI